MKELIGKVINEIWIDCKEQALLKFKTDQGDFVYHAYGDCCSESWFNDIIGVDCLLGKKVAFVREVEVADGCKLEKSRQDFDDIMTIVIVTEVGIADIIFRNSSNGYYGGSCDYVKPSEPNYAHLLQTTELVQLHSDYSADDSWSDD